MLKLLTGIGVILFPFIILIMTRYTILLFAFFVSASAQAQLSPEVTSWVLNETGAKGYGGIASNVQVVQYSADWVYVSCTCIPGYDIGPWQGNPNTPANQNFVFKVTRKPVKNTGTATATPLGHIGIWTNGVSMFNALDARSYNNQNIWHQNAVVVEGPGFDQCLGHPAPNGEYHHHLNPRCLYNDADSSKHSPIIGYAFDGFPMYGAYGYKNIDGTGGITRMLSSYRGRTMTNRTIDANGNALTAAQYGPDISASYPLGYYSEDFQYVKDLGNLDEHNGRFCVTPEYPQGTYAYFVTIDSALNGAYPYTVGATYYGAVVGGNTGPASGHTTIAESVTVYHSQSDVQTLGTTNTHQFYPNPASTTLYLSIDANAENNMKAEIINNLGQVVSSLDYVQPSITYTLDVSQLPNGIYFLKLSTPSATSVEKIMVSR